MRAGFVTIGMVLGCAEPGKLDLYLEMPTDPVLRPNGMSTVTVIASGPDLDSISNTSEFGQTFSAGELPVSSDVQIDVELRDRTTRLVGFGEALEQVDLSNDQATRLVIPVRRPFVYAASGTALYSFDPSRDSRDDKFQGQLLGLTNPKHVVAVGARLVVAGGSQLQIIDTATHMVSGAIELPAGAVVEDIARIAGRRAVAVATSAGISFVDLDSATVTTANVGAVDRISVGLANGRTIAYGLIGRVAPPETPLAACTGTSAIIAVDVDAPDGATPVPLGTGVSAIAAAPDTLYGALPCDELVVRIATDGVRTPVIELQRAALLAVVDDRLIAVGTRPSVPVCTMACTMSSSLACPSTSNNRVSYVNSGANLVVLSIPLAGGDANRIVIPERHETTINTEDASGQLAQMLPPLSSVPLDLVASGGGQFISIVAQHRYYTEALSDPISGPILPCQAMTTNDWLMIDLATSSIAQRVRSKCDLTYSQNAYFQTWTCSVPPLGELSTQGEYSPTSIGALFGGT